MDPEAPQMPYEFHTRLAMEFEMGDAITIADAEANLRVSIFSASISDRNAPSPHRQQQVRFSLITRQPLQLESSTDLERIFHVQRRTPEVQFSLVEERTVALDLVLLNDSIRFTRHFLSGYIDQHEDADALNDHPPRLLVLPLTWEQLPTASGAVPVSDEDLVEQALSGEFQPLPSMRATPEDVGEWLAGMVDRDAMAEVDVGGGGRTVTTLSLAEAYPYALHGFDRWWRLRRYVREVYGEDSEVLPRSGVVTGPRAGRPWAQLAYYAQAGDKALELVAILNAGLLQLATDVDWNADEFQIHLDNVKGDRPLTSEMILAEAYQHLQNMSFDPRRILPRSPAEMPDRGLTGNCRITRKNVADMAEAAPGWVMVHRNRYDISDTVPILRNGGFPLPNLPNPFPQNGLQIQAPATPWTPSLLPDENAARAFEGRIGYTFRDRNWLRLVFSGTLRTGRCRAVGGRPYSVKCWWIMQKFGAAILNLLLLRQLFLACPTWFRPGQFDAMMQRISREGWIGERFSQTLVGRLMERAWARQGPAVTDTLRFRTVQVILGAIFLDNRCRFTGRLVGLYDQWFRTEVQQHVQRALQRMGV